jgi:hypothetical protein
MKDTRFDGGDMKTAVFWDVAPSNTFPRSCISFTLKMEATCSSERSVYNKLTQHHIPEDILRNFHKLMKKNSMV